MKRFLIISLVAMMASMANAQLRVDSVGSVSVGDNFTNFGSNEILKVNGTATTGISTSVSNKNSSVKGIRASAYSDGNLAVGVSATASGAILNCGISGTVMPSAGTVGGIWKSGGAAILGTTGLIPTMISGYYAGYFLGDVKVTGSVNGTFLSSAASSNSEGGGASVMAIGINRGIADRLNNVDLLQMGSKNQDGSLATNYHAENNAEESQSQYSSISYGLAADQLKEVFPELVYEDEEGNYSVNYVEMVPLLVQSIKELKNEVTELKEQLGISNPTKPVLKTKGKGEDVDNATLIVPDDVHEATLNVYDLTGKLLRTVSVGEGETKNLSAYTRGLPQGTYAYTLTVNGRQQKARKVVVKN